jgi:hypothetical protein
VSHQGACAVCGRTILDGEQVCSHVSAEGRHAVCALCVERAAELGWLAADQEGVEERMSDGSSRRPGFFARLFARPEPGAGEIAADAEEDLGVDADAVAEIGAEKEVELELPPPPAEAVPLSPPAEAPQPPPPDPAGRGMRPRRLQPDLSPAGRFERAIARFNASEAGRTVAGLTRTLGAPSVSVGDLAGAADEVRVTVAWELTWYQWGVDLGDELRPVYELRKGFEVGEIDAAARQWNASAHDGRIVMVAPPRHEAAAGRPVHH